MLVEMYFYKHTRVNCDVDELSVTLGGDLATSIQSVVFSHSNDDNNSTDAGAKKIEQTIIQLQHVNSEWYLLIIFIINYKRSK